MSRVAYCSRCNSPSLVGAIHTGEEICASCASVEFNCSEYIIAQELVRKSGMTPDNIIEQIEKLRR